MEPSVFGQSKKKSKKKIKKEKGTTTFARRTNFFADWLDNIYDAGFHRHFYLHMLPSNQCTTAPEVLQLSASGSAV
jgi:hypothetical protein